MYIYFKRKHIIMCYNLIVYMMFYYSINKSEQKQLANQNWSTSTFKASITWHF